MKLTYIADPMCSWCYGFGRAIDDLLSADAHSTAPSLQMQLLMGGLRPYTTEPIGASRIEEVMQHWQKVQQATGLPFAEAPNTAVHEAGFVYDTEPASRAVVSVRNRWPQQAWPYFKAVQRAFYAQALNVTRTEVLADLAEQCGLNRADFISAFESTELREATALDFAQAQAWGIRVFPTLVAEHGGELHLVAGGYVPLPTLQERVQLLRMRRG